MSDSRERPLCPSAQPGWPQSVLIGVVGGTADHPKVRFTERTSPVSAELLRLAEPVQPTEVFRFAAPCLCHGCLHFHGEKCRLVERVVKHLPAVTADLPQCAIRPNCRWWRQEGAEACARCPQVVTENHNPSLLMIEAARPQPASSAPPSAT